MMRSMIVALALLACGERPSPHDVAERDLARLYDAFTQWAAEHPAIACPAELAVLLRYLPGKTNALDPWGTTYKIRCGTDAPPAARGFGVQSAGPDMRIDTADDIKTWL